VANIVGEPTAATAGAHGADRSEPRRRSRGPGHLPGPRALTGAALIVVAAAGVLMAHRSASQPPTTRYVVAARDIPAGHALSPDDLGTLAADLPSGMPAVAATDASTLLGRVTRGAVSELDLLRPTDVVDAGRFTEPGSVEVPVQIDPARALDGAIRAGSRVDVLSTDPDAQGTTVLAREVPVVSVAGPSEDGIGGSPGLRVRLAAPDADAATAIVDAAVRSRITLVLPTPVEGVDRG